MKRCTTGQPRAEQNFLIARVKLAIKAYRNNTIHSIPAGQTSNNSRFAAQIKTYVHQFAHNSRSGRKLVASRIGGSHLKRAQVAYGAVGCNKNRTTGDGRLEVLIFFGAIAVAVAAERACLAATLSDNGPAADVNRYVSLRAGAVRAAPANGMGVIGLRICADDASGDGDVLAAW